MACVYAFVSIEPAPTRNSFRIFSQLSQFSNPFGFHSYVPGVSNLFRIHSYDLTGGVPPSKVSRKCLTRI